MKLYLAGRFERRKGLAAIAADLRDLCGVEITSRWLDTHFTRVQEGAAVDPLEIATKNLSDLQRADVVVVFSDEPGKLRRGGDRHVEFGLALGLGKAVFLVGPRELTFHSLPHVFHFNDVGEMFAFLRQISGKVA